MAEADKSLRDSSSEDLEVDPTPELVIINSSSNFKVGQKITLELRHVMPQQEVEIKVIPDGVHIEDRPTTNLMGTTDVKRYILVPRKYGGYKVTVEKIPAEDDDANRSINPVFIHVIPMGELKLRVTGLPQQVQLPRDVLVDKSDLIVADGIRRRVIRVPMVQESEQEEFMVPCENFSPIGLAMKRDTTSEENNELYVTDLTNACVHVFHGPKHLESFGKNVLKRPTGIAIDDDGFIFVADHEAKRIFQFNPDCELVNDDTPHPLSGPQLMTIHKVVSSGGTESSNLFVANRTESKVSLFNIQQATEAEPYKKLVHITDLKIDIDALNCKFVMPFSVACDLDGHVFIAGQVMTQNGDKKGFIWFKDNNSSLFGGSKLIDWSFGGGLRNPGGMCIVEEVDGRYLYITDMRGRNANNCINKYLL